MNVEQSELGEVSKCSAGDLPVKEKRVDVKTQQTSLVITKVVLSRHRNTAAHVRPSFDDAHLFSRQIHADSWRRDRRLHSATHTEQQREPCGLREHSRPNCSFFPASVSSLFLSSEVCGMEHEQRGEIFRVSLGSTWGEQTRHNRRWGASRAAPSKAASA